MAIPIPVHFSDVLTAVQRYLLAYPSIASLGLSTDRIFLCLENNPEHTTGDYRIGLQPMNEHRDPTAMGSGRVEFRAIRILKIMAMTRLGTDEQIRDTDWLQGALSNGVSPTIGHLAFEDMICDAMILFQPTDSFGNALTYKPCVYRSIERPERTQADRASGYGRSWLYFDVPYIRILNQAQQ